MRLFFFVVVVIVVFLVVVCSFFMLLCGVIVVNNFDVKCYFGIWYEIVCFDYCFECGLEKVIVIYSLCDDGGLNVINKGYNFDRGMWQQSEGKVYFIGVLICVVLKVLFFGFFYGGYNVIVFDWEYCYVLVCGLDCDYLWIFFCMLIIFDEVKQEMLVVVIWEGFDVSKFIWVQQFGSQ